MLAQRGHRSRKSPDYTTHGAIDLGAQEQATHSLVRAKEFENKHCALVKT